MAIKNCKECGKDVSTSAKQCPHCGKRYPTGGFTIPAKIGVVVLVLGAVGLIPGLNLPTTSPAPPPPSEPVVVAASAASPVGSHQPMPKAAISALQDSVNRALAGFRHKHDRVEEIDFYHDKSSPLYLNTRSNLEIYIVKNGNDLTLRLLNMYSASDWLFIQDYAVNVDGIKLSLTADGIERDNNSGIWEWTDHPVDADDPVILAIARGKDVLLKYDGQQYSKTRTISAQEKRAMLHVLKVYDMMSRLGSAGGRI